MPVLQLNVPIDPVRPRGSPGGEPPQRHGLESTESQRSSLAHLSRYQVITEADLIFRIDAAKLGYLEEPRGMARYYRDYGMLPPRYSVEQIPRFELTSFDLDRVLLLPIPR